MTNAMRLVDGWTILMIFILAVELIIALLCRKKKEKEDEDEDEDGNNVNGANASEGEKAAGTI